MTLSICIQAGGQSRRMGQNKALLKFDGQPLIQRVVSRVRSIASELIVISNDSSGLEFLDLPVIPDLIPGRGALSGLYTSLAISTHPFVAPVACDMPFVNASLLQAELHLIQSEAVDVVIPESASGLEPLHAVYRRETCLPIVKEALFQEGFRMTGWLDRVKVHILPQTSVAQFDPDHLAFININTPGDLAMAESLKNKDK